MINKRLERKRQRFTQNEFNDYLYKKTVDKEKTILSTANKLTEQNK